MFLLKIFMRVPGVFYRRFFSSLLTQALWLGLGVSFFLCAHALREERQSLQENRETWVFLKPMESIEQARFQERVRVMLRRGSLEAKDFEQASHRVHWMDAAKTQGDLLQRFPGLAPTFDLLKEDKEWVWPSAIRIKGVLTKTELENLKAMEQVERYQQEDRPTENRLQVFLTIHQCLLVLSLLCLLNVWLMHGQLGREIQSYYQDWTHYWSQRDPKAWMLRAPYYFWKGVSVFTLGIGISIFYPLGQFLTGRLLFLKPLDSKLLLDSLSLGLGLGLCGILCLVSLKLFIRRQSPC